MRHPFVFVLCGQHFDEQTFVSLSDVHRFGIQQRLPGLERKPPLVFPIAVALHAIVPQNRQDLMGKVHLGPGSGQDQDKG